jgi:TetR/AcrR family transcriptional regulator, cholesterol catabolism regulator
MSDRRVEILNVAMEIFAERGVKATTVREIGNQAGILSGSLYHHFGSKLDIVDAILSQFCDDILEHYKRIATADASAVERLRMLARYAFSLVEDQPHALMMFYSEGRQLVATEPRFSYLADFDHKIERHWTSLIKAGAADGELRRDVDPKLVYRIVRDSIGGAVHWFRPSRSRTIEDTADDFIDLLLQGLLAR